MVSKRELLLENDLVDQFLSQQALPAAPVEAAQTVAGDMSGGGSPAVVGYLAWCAGHWTRERRRRGQTNALLWDRRTQPTECSGLVPRSRTKPELAILPPRDSARNSRRR